jgi:hypothetical protein
MKPEVVELALPVETPAEMVLKGEDETQAIFKRN